MHASIEQLLTLRDSGDTPAEVRRHVVDCRDCATTLDELNEMRSALARLPVFEPPQDRWDLIAGRAAEAEPRRRVAAMLAAGIAAAITIAVIVAQIGPSAWPDKTTTASTLAVDAPDADSIVPLVVDEPLAPDALRAESRRLETLLRNYRSYRPQIDDPALASAVRGLEAQIAAVDYGLTYAAEVPLDNRQADLLWQQRVDMMESIVQIRGAELRRVEYQTGLR